MNFRELKKPEQNVINLFRTINFGRIENLIVENGLLKATPDSRKISTSNFEHDDREHRVSRTDGDFILNEQQKRFFERIHRLENGRIKSISIRAGLPVSAEIDEAVASI